jgi:hypothetical protein
LDIYKRPENIDANVAENLGPLAPLAGIWEGDKGIDIAPTKDGPVSTEFRERIVLEPMGPVVNGPQLLYGLRYSTTAWPLGSDDAFHEEVGYWLWDPREELAMRYFIVPRGVAVAAGAKCAPDARKFDMRADIGSNTFGILSNPFLDVAFRTVAYRLNVEVFGDNSFSYVEDTQIELNGNEDVFHHTDENRLTRVG